MESTARTEADIEELEGEPVPDGAGALPAAPAGPRLPVRASVPPGAQVVAVAAGGFIAGAATVALARRHQRRAALARRSARRPAPAGELVQILATRSLLVDVHLLGGRGG